MPALPNPSRRMTQLVTMLCALALWFSTSCDARNQRATTMHTFERPTKSSAPRFIPYEMLVKFKEGTSQERIASILKETQVGVLAEIQRGRLYHVKILDDRSVESAIAHLASYQEIEYAEPNYRYETQK